MVMLAIKRALWQPSGPQRLVNCGEIVSVTRRLSWSIGENCDKIDYVDRARKKGNGPVSGDFESLREKCAIAMVVKSGKPKRTKWLMDTGCGHEAMTLMTANGITETDQKVDLVIDEMKDTISPFVMEESLSLVHWKEMC